MVNNTWLYQAPRQQDCECRTPHMSVEQETESELEVHLGYKTPRLTPVTHFLHPISTSQRFHSPGT